MTKYSRMLQVITGGRIDRPPVSVRIDLWHNGLRAQGSVSEEIKNFTTPEVEDYLGFARTARFNDFFHIDFKGVTVNTEQKGQDTLTEMRYKGRVLTQITSQTDNMNAVGIHPYTKKYFLQTEKDYDLLIAMHEHAVLSYDIKGYEEYRESVGDLGLTMLILGPCPIHFIMLKYVGYENFFYNLHDFPGKVRELILRIERLYRSQLWPAVIQTSSEIVLHGVNFTEDIMPPTLFTKYFLPYLSDFCEKMKSAGKWTGCHADGELGALAEILPDCGYTFADCLATRPLARRSLEDYFKLWKGKIKCWGGLPSVIFDSTYPDASYRDYVWNVVDLTKVREDFIFGASDNVLPGTPWERLLFLAEATGSRSF